MRRRPVDPATRARAESLHSSGMPMQMAMAVAHGKLALNEALERLARRDAVNRLMEKHQLSRALATQIALGQAALETVLATRRLEGHRESYRDRSVLEEHAASGAPLTLLLHGQRRVTGRVTSVGPYTFRVRVEDAPADAPDEEIHKLQVKLAFSPEAYKRVRKALKFDKRLQDAPRAPIPRPQDRYACSDRRLFRYLDARTEIHATTLEGEQLRGYVAWFSRFEFGLQLKGDAVAVVFRHALHDISE